MLLDQLLGSMGLPKEVMAPALRLLSTAASTSSLPRYHNALQQQQAAASMAGGGALEGGLVARHGKWASIRAGLEGLGISAESIQRCKQGTLHLPGKGGGKV